MYLETKDILIGGNLDGLEKVVAFYLPQFYRNAMNNEWWGDGFTEWTNVSKAGKVYPGHHQPQVPGQLGFYDTTHPSTLKEQVELAKKFGIHGFCFYYYWFSGTRALDKPLDLFLESDLDFPFMVSWANENWTKTWDGGNREVLLPQGYEIGWEQKFFQDTLKYLLDHRYIRVANMPALCIYRPEDLPDPSASIEMLRNMAKAEGLDGLYVVGVSGFKTSDPRDANLDAIIELPPLGDFHKLSSVRKPPGTLVNFNGNFFDYGLAALGSLEKTFPNWDYFPGAMPGWDNTPRRQNDSNIYINPTDEKFALWLAGHRLRLRENQNDLEKRFIFINAWNEWAEGAHLEPDIKDGLTYLEAVRSSTHLAMQYSGNFLGLQDELRRVTQKDLNKDAEVEVQFAHQSTSFIRGIAREFNIENFHRFVDLYAQDRSGRELLAALSRVRKNWFGNRIRWTPTNYKLAPEEETAIDRKPTVGVFAHVFYPSYISKFIKAAERTSSVVDKFYLTTPKPEIAREIIRRASDKNIQVVVAVSENRGRHFAPLFVEFSQEIAKFDYIVHVHSKKSPHRFGFQSSAWSRQAWAFLVGDSKKLQNLVNTFERDPSLGLAYAVDLRITPPSGFSWRSNYEAAKTYLGHKIIGSQNKRFPYPAGGMFFCRSSVILPLAQHYNDYSLFPIERGQLDGTTQHAIERLVGVLATNLGYKHLLYHSRDRQLTLDVDFVNL